MHASHGQSVTFGPPRPIPTVTTDTTTPSYGFFYGPDAIGHYVALSSDEDSSINVDPFAPSAEVSYQVRSAVFPVSVTVTTGPGLIYGNQLYLDPKIYRFYVHLEMGDGWRAYSADWTRPPKKPEDSDFDNHDGLESYLSFNPAYGYPSPTPTPPPPPAPTPTPTPTVATVNFNTLPPNQALTQFPTGVTWQTAKWKTHAPMGELVGTCVGFAPGVTSGSISFNFPQTVTSLKVYNDGDTSTPISLITSGSSASIVVGAKQSVTLYPGWTASTSTLTVSANQNCWFDDFVLTPDGVPPLPTPTPTPTPPPGTLGGVPDESVHRNFWITSPPDFHFRTNLEHTQGKIIDVTFASVKEFADGTPEQFASISVSAHLGLPSAAVGISVLPGTYSIGQLDSDHDGLSDLWEIIHYGTIHWNDLPTVTTEPPGPTVPVVIVPILPHPAFPDRSDTVHSVDKPGGDFDGDGVGDRQEGFDGTAWDNSSVNKPTTVTFSFDRLNWKSDQGLRPTVTASLQTADGFIGKGLSIQSNDQVLAFPATKPDGSLVVPWSQGTVRLWFKTASWVPGAAAGLNRFLEVGAPSSVDTLPQWAILAQPSTRQLTFQNVTGDKYGFFWNTPGNNDLTWTPNVWNQLALVYSPTSRSLYLNGAHIATDSSQWLGDMTMSRLVDASLYLANDSTGGHPFHGVIDQVEISNFEMDSDTIRNDFTAADSKNPDSTTVTSPGMDSDTDGLTNQQEVLYRTNPGDSDSDKDGLPDGYEVAKGLNPTDPSDAFDDADGDGVPNIFEYKHGWDPTKFGRVADSLHSVSSPPPVITVDPSVAEGTNQYQSIGKAAEVLNALGAGGDYAVVDVKQAGYSEKAIFQRAVLLLNQPGAKPIDVTSYGASQPMISFYGPAVIDGFWFHNYAPMHGVGAWCTGTISGSTSHYEQRFINCLFTDNAQWPGFGGSAALQLADARVSLYHCTFLRNQAQDGANAVSGNGALKVVNTILWDVVENSLQEIQTSLSVTVLKSIIHGGQFGANPNDPSLTHDGYLTKYSIAIDNGATVNTDGFDFQGEPRGLPDIGADEFRDTDCDGLPDWWEMQYFGSIEAQWGLGGPHDDYDQDGLKNLYEYELDFNPVLSKTDPNGFGDLYEALTNTRQGWVPPEWELDTDHDGLTDGWEIYYKTDPTKPDSNDDGISDGASVASGIDPAKQDIDGDGIPNKDEIAQGTNPYLKDTDGDGVWDGQDAYPQDPTKSVAPVGSSDDHDKPVIYLDRPLGATPQ